MSKHTIRECLQSIAIVSDDDFSDCGDIQEEFRVIKRKSHERFLETHPDKGGDAAEFRRVRTSFEVLRELYDNKKVQSFRGIAVQQQRADSYDATFADFADMPTPSWEFYYAAAYEIIPIYRIERAKSGRSRCQAVGPGRTCTASPDQPSYIDAGAVRIGSILQETGTYTRFVHLECWRVPNRVWEGLPSDPEVCDREVFAKALRGMNEVVLCGFSELPEEQQDEVVDYVKDKTHWARKTKRKREALRGGPAATASDGTMATTSSLESERGLVPSNGSSSRELFRIPVPGRDGAVANVLQGKTVVLTGTFPEVGGGIGLSLGKDRVKAMIQSFGGKVTGSISGRTDILIVGKEPGFSKVSKAREREKCHLISLRDLATDVLRGSLLEDAPAAAIVGFSAGYGGNSLAAKASEDELAIAYGTIAPRIADGADKKPAGRPSKKRATVRGKVAPRRTKMANVGECVSKAEEIVVKKEGESKKTKKKATVKKTMPSTRKSKRNLR